jgi:hypothetical protein
VRDLASSANAPTTSTCFVSRFARNSTISTWNQCTPKIGIAYRALSPEQKRAFFDEKQRSGIHAYLDSTKEFITFGIPNVAIVDELIGNLFFKPELDEDDDEQTEPISKANALKLYRPIFDRDEEDMEDGAANDE